MDEALIVQELRLKYPFKDLLDVSKIERSSYYYLIKKSTKIDKYKDIKNKISDIFNKHKGRYGYRRIHLSLINLGIKINHKTVYKLMKALNFKSLVRVKKYKSVEELKVDIDEYIYYYNNYRIKEKLKGQSPISFRTSSLISA